MRHIIITILSLLSLHLIAQEDSITSKPFKVDQIQIQYGGYIGMLSIGPYWQSKKKKTSIGVNLGYVPNLNNSKAHTMVSFKAAYTPNWDIDIKKVTINPLHIGIAGSYTFGKQFNKYQDEEYYPDDYYWWHTALRFGLFHQLQSSLELNNQKSIHLYFESSMWDINYFSYSANNNKEPLTLWDITTLALGVKYDL